MLHTHTQTERALERERVLIRVKESKARFLLELDEKGFERMYAAN